MKKRYLPLVIFLLIVAMFLVQLLRNAQGDDPRNLESALIGKPVPEAPLESLWGKKLDYKTLFQQGKPILINVWATWCPSCYAEHAYLRTLKQDGVTIIGVDYRDGLQKAREWLTSFGDPYQETIQDENGSFGLDLGIYGTPETFLVDGNGIIRYRFAGALDDDVWKTKFLPLYQKYSAGEKK